MNVNDLYQLMLYIVGKNLQQGYVSPQDFFITINAAQKNYTSFLLGTFQRYTPGRPVANVELGQNSVVRQRLTPIIYGYNLNVDITGFSPFPGDYLQTDAMWSIYGLQRVRFADQHKLSAIYGSKIDPIISNPIYVLEDAGFRFYPAHISSRRLSYVKDPPDMVWGFDEVDGVAVYNPSKSTQPVWDDLALFEILSRALSMVGVNLNAAMVMGYSQEIKNNGQ